MKRASSRPRSSRPTSGSPARAIVAEAFDRGSADNLTVQIVRVDELLGQQQVVVKNLEANYRRVSDISGATILGDGRVALILDVGALVRRSRH